MTRHWTPVALGGLVAEKPGKVGSTARGWQGLRQLLADRWNGERPREVVQLWIDAQSAPQLPIAIRVRAATALKPVR